MKKGKKIDWSKPIFKLAIAMRETTDNLSDVIKLGESQFKAYEKLVKKEDRHLLPNYPTKIIFLSKLVAELEITKQQVIELIRNTYSEGGEND